MTVCNVLFHLNLRYYTGPFICKTSLVKQAHLTSDGNTFLAELRVRLIGHRATVLEIPFLLFPVSPESLPYFGGKPSIIRSKPLSISSGKICTGH